MDRLAELQSEAALLSNNVPATGPVKIFAAEPPSAQSVEAASLLEAFYSLVVEASGALERAEQLTQELPKKHLEMVGIVDRTKGDTVRQEVEEIMRQVNVSARNIGQIIDTMKKETDKLKVKPEIESNFAGVIRIEENQQRYILFRLSRLMNEYQREQNSIEEMYRSQTERQIKIKYTNPDGSAIDDKTAKELALAVLENNTTNSIFQQSKDVLDQIIETRNDIYRIEVAMHSLNQLFNDLAYLVHEQGEIMDVVLKNICHATRYVVSGRNELKRARKYRKRSRRKLCFIVLVLGGIIILFVLAVVLGKVL